MFLCLTSTQESKLILFILLHLTQIELWKANATTGKWRDRTGKNSAAAPQLQVYKLNWKVPPWWKGNKTSGYFLSASRCSQNSYNNTYFSLVFRPCVFNFCSFKSLSLTAYWTINMLCKWAFKMNRADRNYKLCCQLLTVVLFKCSHENWLFPDPL